MSAWSKVSQGDVEERERRGGGASSRDIAGRIGAESMALRVWRYGPGHEMAYHRHQDPGGGLPARSPAGPRRSWSRARSSRWRTATGCGSRRTPPRRIQNHSDREAVWLTIGAPPGAGITDGIRLDPETGEEIPRT